jgi:hypothetical protein
MDKQFPGLHNDLLFLWAMVDTAVSRDIAWMHGTMQQDGGPTPANSWSTMDIIKIRATPRD